MPKPNLVFAKPNLVFAMNPDVTSDLITPPLLARLAESCTILSEAPLRDYGSAAARALLAEAAILFTGWGAPKLDAAALALAPGLRLVAHAGSAVKPIAAPEIWQAGIAVTSAAAANAVPVAEYALAAILLANKRAFGVRERFRRERKLWQPQWLAPGEPGNYGAVIGIVGASRIGRRLLALLKPFDLEVLVCDPFLSEEEALTLGVEKSGLHELMARADVVSLHAPSLPETTGMIGRAELAAMRDGTTLINTARGALVDHAALAEELISGRLNAVLDVTEPEPLPPDSRLFDLPNVVLTPHIAGAAGYETRRMAELLVEEIERFVAGKPLQHEVTAAMLARVA
ncbi:hydroxyacid dehydrogenase [Bosea caraganae]|uniref:Hydroxyacid dehydrogenase n=1 Tax=Bosea caraganae TaxID=2763117 RepID=A0A370L299_9HYPH|nr:hydroxyacid dehydrogenase [Bosea caraganae]RDJ22263.1 hydroxyacid dehydrogenase [Bosea caraganae]RDJ22650.1 hydroxyacid dehydrogenase [Bosea caraganae]